MFQTNRMKYVLIAAMLIVAMMLAACGGDEPEPTATPEPPPPTPTEAAAEAAPTEAPAEQAEAPAPDEEAPTTSESTMTASMVDLPEVDPLAVTGDIITAGSSTVFPLSERMAERFQREGYGGNITIDSIGSGAGFERSA